ncbi:MAG: hypothetical protein PVG24_10970 [Gammaproteobacteria bacterium]
MSEVLRRQQLNLSFAHIQNIRIQYALCFRPLGRVPVKIGSGDDIVIARSGATGIDSRLFAADKVHNVTHVQSLLMLRHALSSLRVNTASTAISIPYMPTRCGRPVVDYCRLRVESTKRSWM